MGDPTLPLAGLSPVSGKRVDARFDGGQLSSDGVLRQFRQSLLPVIAARATFAWNAGLWLRRGRLLILCSCLAAFLATIRQKIQLSQCADFLGHLSAWRARRIGNANISADHDIFLDIISLLGKNYKLKFTLLNQRFF